MSITDFVNKIKEIKDIDNFTYLYLIIIVFIGLSAFGLGRLSVSGKEEITSSIVSTKEQVQTNNISDSANNITEKNFLASKNGKLYYTIECSGAKRIAEKNIIWFSTNSEAELAGYKMSASCNK
jgi:hypothetical protein